MKLDPTVGDSLENWILDLDRRSKGPLPLLLIHNDPRAGSGFSMCSLVLDEYNALRSIRGVILPGSINPGLSGIFSEILLGHRDADWNACITLLTTFYINIYNGDGFGVCKAVSPHSQI